MALLTGVRWLTERLLFPVLLGGGLVAAWWMAASGLPGWAAVTAPVAVVALVLLLLERLIPKERSWSPPRQTQLIDLLHSLICTSGVPALLRLGLFGLLYTLAEWLAQYGFALWPRQAPLLLQLFLALAVGELGAYWIHRLCHRYPLGWRLHALHHSIDGLHMMASGRNHPLNVLFSYTAQITPLILLGAGSDALLLMSVFTGIHGLLQHVNVEMRLGVLNHVFAGPELHHWHHSIDMAESNTNFGSNLILWDIVFGTRYYPNEKRPGAAVGVEELSVRENFWAHLALPFIYRRYEVSVDPATPLTPASGTLSSGTLSSGTLSSGTLADTTPH